MTNIFKNYDNIRLYFSVMQYNILSRKDIYINLLKWFFFDKRNYVILVYLSSFLSRNKFNFQQPINDASWKIVFEANGEDCIYI